MDIVKTISDFTTELNDANRKTKGCNSVNTPAYLKVELSEPSTLNVTKINVDVGCFKDESHVGD
jgi:hypothetical protein